MKFNSRKDAFFTIVVFGSIALLASIVVEILMGDLGWVDSTLLSLLLLIMIFILWIFFDTSYKLNENSFSYRSGPLKGSIEINRINEVIKGKTMWVGYKPATAQKGLIIKYEKFNEIYISPKTNDLFIAKLLELNSEIIITE